MAVDEGALEEGSRLRPMFASLGEITRSDGSVVFCQGDTTVGCSVFGPGEVRMRMTGDVVDRAAVEVILKPRLGLPQVDDKAHEARIVSTCTSAVLTVLHPRTCFSVNIQVMQEDGCLESACVNAACLALLDASVSLKFLVASVTVALMKDDTIICDPTQKQFGKKKAHMTFVFSSRQSNEDSPSLVSTYVEGRVSPEKLQECLVAAHISSQEIFKFYRSSIARKFSKELS